MYHRQRGEQPRSQQKVTTVPQTKMATIIKFYYTFFFLYYRKLLETDFKHIPDFNSQKRKSVLQMSDIGSQKKNMSEVSDKVWMNVRRSREGDPLAFGSLCYIIQAFYEAVDRICRLGWSIFKWGENKFSSRTSQSLRLIAVYRCFLSNNFVIHWKIKCFDNLTILIIPWNWWYAISILPTST